jgi:hypothetical protein
MKNLLSISCIINLQCGAKESQGKDASLPSTSACQKPRWLTQTLQDAHEHVGAPKTLVRESIPPKRFFNHVALTSSIGEPSNFVEARCGVMP